MLLHSERLDRVVLMSGDGDFLRLVQALQDKGIWVDVAAYQGVSGELARACNQLTNPLLIPGVHYSPEYSFKRVFRVTGFNMREMAMSIEYLRVLRCLPRSIARRLGISHACGSDRYWEANHEATQRSPCTSSRSSYQEGYRELLINVKPSFFCSWHSPGLACRAGLPALRARALPATGGG
ncbi:TPA: NYN domain-containing protein [Pseudomonas aeruginosa]|nr:NYN domain-containing protein [Pseudomonas aeruginosa]